MKAATKSENDKLIKDVSMKFKSGPINVLKEHAMTILKRHAIFYNQVIHWIIGELEEKKLLRIVFN